MEADGGEVLGWWLRTGERPEELPRVSVRRLREFTASMQSSGQCQGVQRGPG
jgi:hypothetical protein